MMSESITHILHHNHITQNDTVWNPIINTLETHKMSIQFANVYLKGCINWKSASKVHFAQHISSTSFENIVGSTIDRGAKIVCVHACEKLCYGLMKLSKYKPLLRLLTTTTQEMSFLA